MYAIRKSKHLKILAPSGSLLWRGQTAPVGKLTLPRQLYFLLASSTCSHFPALLLQFSCRSHLTSPNPWLRALGSKAKGGFLAPAPRQSRLQSHSPAWHRHAPRDAPCCPGQLCHPPPQKIAPARREAGSVSPSSNAQLRHAQQFSILSAIFCSTELVVCIELVFIFPNMIYKHNHVSDFDIALGSTAGMHLSPGSAGWGALQPRRSLQWEYSKCGAGSCSH